MSWVDSEVHAAKMPDKRLKTRLHHLLNQLSQTPDESIPDNCSSWSETLAAYRFFDNENVTPASILSGHIHATCQRIAKEPVVLLVQDTTFLSLISEAEEIREGCGMHHTQSAEYCLHPTIAFTPQRVNLGTIGHTFWQREESTQTDYERSKLPIEDKSSYRWWHSYDMACAVQARYPDTCIVSVADREGDIYYWLLHAQDLPLERKAEYVIRASTDRRLEDDDEDTSTLFATLQNTPPLGTMTIALPRRPQGEARTATVRLSAKRVTFRRPKRYRVRTASVEVTAVYVHEVAAPANEKAIEWLLLTSVHVENLSQAQTILGWYKARWEIELYFRVLKNGCTVEKLRLETDRRLENAIALYMIIAWRLHNITMLAREQPDASCEIAFTRDEWRMLYVRRKKAIPEQPPTLRDCTRQLAQLGGFLARNGDGEPGLKTIWRGYTRLLNALETIAALNEIRGQRICV